MELTDDERQDIERRIAETTPADEGPVRTEFARKYGRYGDLLLSSRFKVVRDLALVVTCFYEMLVDPDFTMPWFTKARIVFALGYFISPVDAIPDAIPVVGFVDDALVVMYVAHMLSGDVARYREFRRSRGKPLPDP